MRDGINWIPKSISLRDAVWNPLETSGQELPECKLSMKMPKVGAGFAMPWGGKRDGQMATAKRRALAARIGGLSLRAKRDPLEYTKAAREAAYHRFEIEVDPQGELSADERGKRANAARRAYMQRLALRRAA